MRREGSFPELKLQFERTAEKAADDKVRKLGPFVRIQRNDKLLIRCYIDERKSIGRHTERSREKEVQ